MSLIGQSPLELQTPLDGEQVLRRGSGERIREGRLSTEKYIQKDKHIFAHLLQLGVADVLAQGQVFDLDTNEELSRLVPVLCSYFSQEELSQLVGEKMAA